MSWTDALQAMLMLLALVAAPLMVWGSAETGLVATVRARNRELLNPLTNSSGQAIGWSALVSSLAWGLGYFGQSHILARFMGIRHISQLGAARRIAVTWVAVGLSAAVLVGMAGVGGLETTLIGADREKVFIRLVDVLFHLLVAGICLAAILAAIMSTADSQLLVASSVVSEDFRKGILRPQASRRGLLWVGRISVVAIAAVAFWLACNPESRVLEIVAWAWAGLGAAFGPVIVMSLFWSQMSRAGAAMGMITGGVTVIVWGSLDGGLLDLYEIVPGAVLAALAAWFFSRAGPDNRAWNNISACSTEEGCEPSLASS